MDRDIKLWVSVGHYSDIKAGGDWEKNWANQAKELQRAGADAIELHFNFPRHQAIIIWERIIRGYGSKN